MTAAEIGEKYARLFRKAGVFISKDNIEQALKTLREGLEFAISNGHQGMVKRFQDEITRIQNPPQSSL